MRVTDRGFSIAAAIVGWVTLHAPTASASSLQNFGTLSLQMPIIKSIVLDHTDTKITINWDDGTTNPNPGGTPSPSGASNPQPTTGTPTATGNGVTKDAADTNKKAPAAVLDQLDGKTQTSLVTWLKSNWIDVDSAASPRPTDPKSADTTPAKIFYNPLYLNIIACEAAQDKSMVKLIDRTQGPIGAANYGSAKSVCPNL